MHLKREDFPIDFEYQSIEIPDSGGVRQSTLAPLGGTLEFAYEDTKTLVDAFHRGYEKSKNGPCLGWRNSNSDYKWISYGEVIERSKNISHGLVHAGMKRGQDSCIIIYSQNCVEYVLVEQACSLQSAVFVPLYDTLGSAARTFIINHVEAEFLVCDTVKKAKSIIDIKEHIPKLNNIVVVEEIDEELRVLAGTKGVTMHQLKDIEELGKNKPDSLLVPCSSDLAIICFTSGTTGNPKGVMLTHGNLLVSVSALSRHIGMDYIGTDDVYISYLPMAHVFDRMGQLNMYMNGGSVGFFRGDVKLLLEDISSLKPTVMAAVPRVLNKVYEKVQDVLEKNKLKKLLFNIALRAKEAELEKGIIRNDSLLDHLVLKSIRNTFGGKIRMLATGGAPISKEVLSFFKCCLGCAIAELYGQTETTGAINATVIGDNSKGPIGPPLSCVLMKLEDVADMGYYACNGTGEILVKGPAIMKGYYKDPVKTAEIFDENGWLHTGDIGRWEKNGALSIIDRKKNLIKLSQGEYISPEKIESVYQLSSYVDMVFVHGDSLENFPVAIVSPDKELLLSWSRQADFNGTWNEICQSEVVKKQILKDMNTMGKKLGLQGFEQVKAIYVHSEGFTLENGILTPTMKVKREVCQRQFKEIIQKMYREVRGKK